MKPHDLDYRTPLFITGYARASQKKKAKRMLRAYIMPQDKVRWSEWAAAHLSLGLNTEAMDDLERAYTDRNYEIMFAAVDPMLGPLRGDPRFRALLARMRLR